MIRERGAVDAVERQTPIFVETILQCQPTVEVILESGPGNCWARSRREAVAARMEALLQRVAGPR